MNTGFCRGLVLAVALTAAGCGSSGGGGSAGTTDGPSAKQALDDLVALLKSAAEEKLPPPARPADLERFEGPFLSATLGIQQKEIVYQWGTTLTGGGGVVAHEAKAAESGGWVLLQTGEVKQMTADEFKSAPKAKK